MEMQYRHLRTQMPDFLCMCRFFMYNGTAMKPWYVYMIRCSDASLYTGVTTDIARRFKEHQESKKGSKYARAKIPLRVVYQETHKSRSEAQIREAQLKKLDKKEKELLVKNQTKVTPKKTRKKA